ncbi:MAG: HDOD domain-containing protein [Fimbriimonadia bacterium]|nr:HDOD domain-containing protein [Fimbriimonadia bacterium]
MGSTVSQFIDKVRDVAVLPQVVCQVMDLTVNPNANARDIERVISIDPGMSSRVLNTVNSAYYGLPRKIASIREAVVFLGFKSLRHIAMTAGVFEMFVGKADKQNIRRRAWWRHSIDAALCGRMVASQMPDVSPDEAYTAGLLHDIGKPLLERYGEASYDEVEQLIAQGLDVLIAEEAIYGCNHAQLGRAISLHWRFPQKLAEAIGDHHAQQAESLAEPSLTAVTMIGNHLAHQLRAAGTDLMAAMGVCDWAFQTLQMNPNTVQALMVACDAELKESPMQALAA